MFARQNADQFTDNDLGGMEYEAPWVFQAVTLKSRDRPHFTQTRHVLP